MLNKDLLFIKGEVAGSLLTVSFLWQVASDANLTYSLEWEGGKSPESLVRSSMTVKVPINTRIILRVPGFYFSYIGIRNVTSNVQRIRTDYGVYEFLVTDENPSSIVASLDRPP